MNRNLSSIILLSVALLFLQDAAGQGFPVRHWNDDMPRHTFSLGIGPSWLPDNNPILNLEALTDENISPAGLDVALRYDWAYFRGYEVSLATGLTYLFTHSSYPVNIPHTHDIRIREALHYVGANAINTKMWFGSRVIWDVCIHAGYLGGTSGLKQGGSIEKNRENGFAGGVSTGVDCLITAWIGIGIHMNVMAGALFPAGSSSSRDYVRANVRVGAVYCF